MARLNEVRLIGRLTRDPEMKYTQTGKPLASLDLALDTRVKKGDSWERGTEFINGITCWGTTAEIVGEHCHRGQLVLVLGHLRTESWQSQEGKTVKALRIVAEDVQFLSPKGEGRSVSQAMAPVPVPD